eukprot:2223630-Pyramimonas_sp.AAC.1
MSSVWTAARMRQSRVYSSLRRIMPMGSALCPSEMKRAHGLTNDSNNSYGPKTKLHLLYRGQPASVNYA